MSTLTYEDTHRTFIAMERHGGGFCRNIARAWYVADPSNKNRIEHAFPELLDNYGPNSAFFYLQNH